MNDNFTCAIKPCTLILRVYSGCANKNSVMFVYILFLFFSCQGMIALILETIDKCSQWKSMRHLAHLIGEDSAARWNDMINYLYLLLGQ